jgi:protoporphyrin/coproporphyrin ferrochelatase
MSDTPDTPAVREGLLLVNLGTPDAPTVKAIRRYYREFLSDPFVLDINPVLRAFLVHGIIVPLRAPKVAPLYESIWTPEGSPLLKHSRDLQRVVQTLLPDIEVLLAMRYGNPSLLDALTRAVGAGVTKLTVLPLFPHEAQATMGSIRDALAKLTPRLERPLDLRILPAFYAQDAFLDAMTSHLRTQIPPGTEHVVFSYHGLPERQIRKADTSGQCLTAQCCASLSAQNANCYRAQCFATTRLLAERLALQNVSTAFQSRLGRDPWIRPFTEQTLIELAAKSVKRVALVTPGFVADCLETLEELGEQMVKRFKEAGGGELTVVPCLNSNAAFANAVAHFSQYGVQLHA